MKKILLLLFIVIVAIAVFISTLNLNKYKPMIEKAVYSSTGYEINIKSKIGISLFPLGVKVSNISIKNPDNFYKNSFATIDALYVGFNPFGLLFGKGIDIKSITIENPRVHIVQNKTGMLNILPVKHQKGGTKNTSKELSINSIKIKNAYIDYNNLKNKQTAQIEGLNIKASFKRNSEAENIFEGISSKGYLDIKSLKINKADLIDTAKAHFVFKNGILKIKPVQYSSFDSDVNGDINIDFESGGLTRIRQKAEKLNLKALSDALYKNLKLNGYVSVKLDIYFNLSDIVKTLNGVFVVNGRNITVIGKNLDRIIDGIKSGGSIGATDIGSFFIVGPLGILADKAYSVGYAANGLDSGKTLIKRIFVKVDIKNGKGYLSDVAFSTTKNRIAAKGVLNFITSRYENVRVAVLNKKGCATIVQKIGGSFSSPKVEVGKSVIKSIAGKISSLFNKLEKAVGIKKATKCKIFYNGVVKQP